MKMQNSLNVHFFMITKKRVPVLRDTSLPYYDVHNYTLVNCTTQKAAFHPSRCLKIQRRSSHCRESNEKYLIPNDVGHQSDFFFWLWYYNIQFATLYLIIDLDKSSNILRNLSKIFNEFLMEAIFNEMIKVDVAFLEIVSLRPDLVSVVVYSWDSCNIMHLKVAKLYKGLTNYRKSHCNTVNSEIHRDSNYLISSRV